MSKIIFQPNGHFNINGIDIHPASDVDADLITVDVTGGPVFRWDESESSFGMNAGLRIQPATDSVTAVQILDSDGGAPVFNVDTVNERVGIGTATPQELLHVGTGIDASDISATDLLVTRAGPSSLSVRDSTNNVETFLFASSVGGVMGTITNDPLNIKTNNTSAIFIDASQKVGIGTDSPDSAFHIKAGLPGVVGSHYAGQLIIQNPTDSVFSNVVITAYESDGSGNPDQQLWYLGSSSGGNTDIIYLNRRNSKLALGTNGIAQMTILGNGNVGIGIASPLAQFHVKGLSDEIQTIIQANDPQNANLVEFQDSDGNVDSKISADRGAAFGAFDDGNYTEIEADGTVVFTGAATVFKDINMGAAVLTRPAVSQPDEVNFVDEAGADTGIASLGFAVGEKVSGNFELEHDYKEGSNLVFHVHWQGVAAPSGTDKVQWQLTYTISQSETTLNATTTIVIETDFDTQYEFKASAFPAITGTNFNIEDQFLFTLERIAASADEYSGDGIVATVGIHYEIDTVGSRQVLVK